MELSTTMPIQRAIPPKLIIFNVVPKQFISRKDVSTQNGIEREIVTVGPPRRRKIRTTTADRSTPITIFEMALFAVCMI